MYSGEYLKDENLFRAFRESLDKAGVEFKAVSDLRSHISTLEAVLELAYEGIVVVDDKGVITMFNKSYADFLGINQKDAIGKHITEVIENTRMHIVLKTGVPEIGWRQRIMNQDMIVQRIPIIEEGKVLGAVGKVMFKNISDLKDLAEKLDILQTKVFICRYFWKWPAG